VSPPHRGGARGAKKGEELIDRGGRYLTSNVNITVPARAGTWESVPIGERDRKFKTPQ
jgi:hypothetical protein